MMHTARWVLLIVFSMIALLFHCCEQNGYRHKSWSADIDVIGSYSSPRLCDLTNDGVLDVVLGAAKNEFDGLDQGVIALDGNSGQILWSVPGIDQVVGSAVFSDVTGDMVPDVFIGGRSAQLYGINGATGDLLWSYEPGDSTTLAHFYTQFNFYNAQIINDQDADGADDLLISNGGNVFASTGSMSMRYPGTLNIISSATGKIIHSAMMPDSMETYMSPVLTKYEADGKTYIIYGTGGESIGGSLYTIPFEDFEAGDLSESKQLLKEEGHGFIAPVSVVDLNGDEVNDIVANWHGGSIIAIDGADHSILWRHDYPDTEINNTACIGRFNNDDTPDVYFYYSHGVWPNSLGTVHVVIDGKSGEILFEEERGCLGLSSGVAFDYDQDGLDEIVVSLNLYECARTFNQNVRQEMLILDPMDKTWVELEVPISSKNIASTPWVGDIDSDGFIDVVYVLLANTLKSYELNGMRVRRLSTPYRSDKPVKWGSYMGSDYDGIYKED